ncbi:MAG: phosphoglycerate dehydrogenase [Bryobacteraceae bacterium]|nr:phosphoglycerate dehydrogenase [Bryobacteraceae bacterium]
MKILVADNLSPAAVDVLRSQPDCDVTISDPKSFHQHLAEAEGLLVRSAAKVTREVIEKSPRLRVIGRAGSGVDNIDLEAATEAGVLVMNTPGGNSVSVAEQTMALMLALARSITQASNSTKSGRWEKKKFVGTELRGKTLGVVGLGSIGREVVLRARPFEMKILAYDPYVSKQWAEDLSIELVDLPRLLAESDYITLHVALTSETRRMISREQFARMKKGVRIVNCARGGIIDEEALREAIESGKVAGAGLDVFESEPPGDNPLLACENLVATPHIGGSTGEAQEIVGIQIAHQVADYLRSGVAVNAVNIPSIAPEQFRIIAPYVELARRLGAFAAQVAAGNPKAVRLTYLGNIADKNTHLIRNGGLAGVLNRFLSLKVNVVNSMQIAAQRGLNVVERHEMRAGYSDSIRLELETDSGTTTVAGAEMFGKPRLIQIDGIYCEALLSGHLTFMKNNDVPGVIGHVGTVLGRNGINIANFSLGRQETPPAPGEPLTAIALVETDQSVPDSVLAELSSMPAVLLARTVEFNHE